MGANVTLRAVHVLNKTSRIHLAMDAIPYALNLVNAAELLA